MHIHNLSKNMLQLLDPHVLIHKIQKCSKYGHSLGKDIQTVNGTGILGLGLDFRETDFDRKIKKSVDHVILLDYVEFRMYCSYKLRKQMAKEEARTICFRFFL